MKEYLNPLPRRFYARDTVEVARDLLGKTLVRKIGNAILSGKIIETEAYRYSDDPASHAFRGMTERNKAMFGQVGMAYVYFTYGMYYCFNAVARSKDVDAGAVLIRAIEPLDGKTIMIKNRRVKNVMTLTNGPAKLTQAFKISKKYYGFDLTKKSELFIGSGVKIKKYIRESSRVGIRNGVDKLWNFKIEY